ncbi:MAG TPA: CAP domain-containing protein [Kineosporiaceae bacterium]
MAAPAPVVRRDVQVAVSMLLSVLLSIGIAALYGRLMGAPQVVLPSDAQRLLALVNGVRADSHCPALRVDAALTEVAQAQARDMVARGFLSSVNPDNEDAITRAARFHYPGMVTEAYAAGLDMPDDVIVQWTQPTGPGAAVAQRIRTCDMVSAGIGFDAGSVLPRLSAHVWVIDLGDR